MKDSYSHWQGFLLLLRPGDGRAPGVGSDGSVGADGSWDLAGMAVPLGFRGGAGRQGGRRRVDKIMSAPPCPLTHFTKGGRRLAGSDHGPARGGS